MTNLTRWRRPSSLTLRRDVEDVLDEFDLPRGLRREIGRLFDGDLSPRTLWSAMDRLLDDFVSPPTLRRRIARLFEPIVGTTRRLLGIGRGAETFAPELDLVERDDAYVLHVDLPGVRDQDVNVTVEDDNVLTITGERRREETKRERGYQYDERSYGSFTRSVQLPRAADASKIEADFRDGVLEVHIPKPAAAQARAIPIRSHGAPEIGAKEEPRARSSGDGGGTDMSHS